MNVNCNLPVAATAATRVKEISIPISCHSRKPCALDWAESKWIRWIYVLFWWWLSPILNTGRKRQLTDDDLFDVSSNDECGQLLKKLENEWEINENKYEYASTWRVIIQTFWKECLLSGLIFFPFIATKIAQPLLLKQIVDTINDNNRPSYEGYLYAIGLGFAIVLQALIHHQYFFRATRNGMHIRIALSSIIYKRLLSLPTSAIRKTTTGQIINLISNDVSKFEELFTIIHFMWAAPLEAIIVFIIIWKQIGIPTLFGYGVLLLSVPLQLFFSKKFGTYRKSAVEWADKRVKVINEILVGCEIVKMYRWEEALENIVCNARKNELKGIRKASFIRAINMGIFFASLPLISLATFGGSWLMGQVLSSANIFMVLSLFSNIRYPLIDELPVAMEKLSESMIASKRINQLMNLSKTARTKTVEEYSSNHSSRIPGSIIMNKASFTWGSTQSCELIDIDLNVTNGLLIGIIGTIGSSKSSFLSAILGEMSLVQGISKVNGKIAYVSQTPWLFAGTIRENILFCQPFNKEKYERVVKACQLITDLRSFLAGDSTIIGEKGVNLSGGQQARISLARALYTDADIYLFDDPLAAVDSSVARSIFKHCISNEGILKNKTRLLVTHQIQFLLEFDHCILLDNGKIEKQGLFNDLLTLDKIKQSYQNQQDHTNERTRRHSSIIPDYDSTNQSEIIDETSIIKNEISVDGAVSINVWSKLFTSSYGWFGLILLIFLMLLGEGIYDATNKWLSIWSSKIQIEQRKTHYSYVYLGLVIGTSIIALLRATYFFHLILCGASTLHNGMLKGVLYSSLRFYESNPVGRILNRFSKDQQVIDELLPKTFFETIQSLIMVLGCIVIVGISNPWILLILVPIIPLFLWLRKYYLGSSRSLKRLESVSRSPVYALFASSLSGLMTIRAFRVQNEFTNLFMDKINANIRAHFLYICLGRWFGLRLDLMTCCFTFLTAMLSIALRNTIDASSVALSLSYCINLTCLFQWAVRQSAETENFMTSAQRVDEYSHIPSEPDFYKGQIEPPVNWPMEGRIEFKDYKLRYRPELEPVLKGIDLEIIPQNRIGIIGRTGAGKSSIFQALFRLIDKSATEGEILIDGIDINTISLNALRSILNIIPQSPILFSNTLRYNLDPFKHYTDEQLWNALEAVQLKTKIYQLKDQLNIQIAEYGSNFSVGECQLICVARAILKPSKILLIDEATAHVDTKTDELIQQVLREKFFNQTILTIAHRVNTIMDSDKIAVMKNGFIDEYDIPKEIFRKQKKLIIEMKNDNKLSSVSM
ncbi:unnamed protein product [Adineta steineri]|uniref:Uncharacterized protein n=1 Tax=Adineta steineri TaxID=433720 RepID=A0A814QQC9_9BILA|nr:unnamed protein product [Adineta steineri]CAF3681023.1 unnamed protein product [Adineta steineri]